MAKNKNGRWPPIMEMILTYGNTEDGNGNGNWNETGNGNTMEMAMILTYGNAE